MQISAALSLSLMPSDSVERIFCASRSVAMRALSGCAFRFGRICFHLAVFTRSELDCCVTIPIGKLGGQKHTNRGLKPRITVWAPAAGGP
jgi:hypothetical protein